MATAGDLPLDQIDGIQAILDECGGQVSAGFVTRKFPGVKKAQIQQNFEVHVVPGKDYYLLNPGVEFDASLVSEVKKEARTKGTKRKPDNPGENDFPGSRKKQKKERSDEPPAELTDDIIDRVRDLLIEHNGQIKGGVLTTLIPGLKRKQLEPHFEVVQAGGADYWLTEFGNEIDFSITNMPKVKSSTEVAGELTDDVIEEIRDEIHANDGCLVSHVFTRRFPGIKKAHVAAHFTVESDDPKGGAYTIRDEGPTPGADELKVHEKRRNSGTAAKAQNPRPSDKGKGKRNSQGTTMRRFGNGQVWQNGPPMMALGNGGSIYIPRLNPRGSVAGFRPVDAIQGKGVQVKKKQDKNERSMDSPPPLTRDQVRDMSQIIADNGGQMNGGVLTRKFRGVKKAQIEAHFLVEQITSGDFLVSLKAGTNGKKKDKKERSTEPPPPLTDDQVQDMYQMIFDSGGQMKGGALTRKFPGVKKAQIEAHFLIEQAGGDFLVSV
eukprot:gnl/MRDRNA2_/MRDRNA2_121526_c0_seq1.p1 gnl/MRDRNA2_/MRDRNA2_121526_c0~~gnl/MRDRNA2_/MRDRNA2_121526_c0_seq1.p1  ORF type:complete len:492 (-),score=107.75 gnl/MRDRNA2_/MRDRNA2_121526_c0_seq1:26-1501(-)